jgi:hypothetical protein
MCNKSQGFYGLNSTLSPAEVRFHSMNDEVIRLDSKGFHYRGQFIADAGEAHRLMVEFLKQNTHPQPEPEFTPEEVEMIQAPWSYLTPTEDLNND